MLPHVSGGYLEQTRIGFVLEVYCEYRFFVKTSYIVFVALSDSIVGTGDPGAKHFRLFR